MRPLAIIRKFDQPNGAIIYLCAEEVEGEDYSPMYLGYKSLEGEDDVIFAFCRHEEDILEEIYSRWGHYETYQEIGYAHNVG